MSNADIERLEALLAKASPAPWDAKTNRHPNLDGIRWGWVDGAVNIVWNGQAEADAKAIAALRNAVPALLAELKDWRAGRLVAHDEECKGGPSCRCFGV